MQQEPIDYEKLSSEIASKLHLNCPLGWKTEDILTLSQFASTLRQGYAAALYILVSTIACAMLAAVWIGIKHSMRQPLVIPFVIIVICLCAGCKTKPAPVRYNNPAPIITTGAIKTATAATTIMESTAKILIATDTIQQNPAIVNTIKEKVTDIEEQCVILKTQGVEMASVSSMLTAVKEDVQILTSSETAAQAKVVEGLAREDELKKVNAELVVAKNAILARNLQYLILLGTIAIAISIFLVLTGNPKATAGAVAGGILILTSMAIMVLTKLLWLFYLLAGLGTTAIIGILTYHLWDYWRQRQGLKDAVATVEMIKPELNAEAKVRLFGAKAVAGIIETVQSATTKEMVKEIRAGLTLNSKELTA